jgi:hypothetical protein
LDHPLWEEGDGKGSEKAIGGRENLRKNKKIKK